jgi:hypothetical protein
MRRFLPLSAASVAGLLLLAACATAPPPPRAVAPPPPPPPPPTPAEEFAWSTVPGNNTLTGVMAYRPNAAEAWSCAGMGAAVALMPETSYSRGRILALYGSADRALQTVAQVRARSAANPGADYGQFVRSTSCDPSDTFTFTALPSGAYFIIARVRQTRPANGGGEIVVMQRVELRGGQAIRVTLPQGMAPAAASPPPPARPAPRPAPRR